MSVGRICNRSGDIYFGRRCDCDECVVARAAANARRGSSTQRGYDARYRRRRDAAIAAQPWCTYCGTEGDTSNPLTADHDPPLAHGGDSTTPLVVACRRCNSARGATVRRPR